MVSVELYCVLFLATSFASDQELVCAFFLALHHYTQELKLSIQLTHHVEIGTLTFQIGLTMIAHAKDTVSLLLVL